MIAMSSLFCAPDSLLLAIKHPFQHTCLLQVASELRKSKRKGDSDLGKALEAELIEPWREAETERKRKEEAAALKEAQRMAAIEAGKNRSLRQRKPVRDIVLYFMALCLLACAAAFKLCN